MRPNYLFRGTDIFAVVENQKLQVVKKVQALESNYMLNASEHDLVAALVDELRLDVPVIKDDEIHIADHRETDVDVSHDPNRFIRDRSKPLYIPGSKTTIAVPFEGDAAFFRISPNTFTGTLPIGEPVFVTLILIPCWQSRRIVIVLMSNVVLPLPSAFGTTILNSCVTLKQRLGGGAGVMQVPTGISFTAPSDPVCGGVAKAW